MRKTPDKIQEPVFEEAPTAYALQVRKNATAMRERRLAELHARVPKIDRRKRGAK